MGIINRLGSIAARGLARLKTTPLKEAHPAPISGPIKLEHLAAKPVALTFIFDPKGSSARNYIFDRKATYEGEALISFRGGVLKATPQTLALLDESIGRRSYKIDKKTSAIVGLSVADMEKFVDHLAKKGIPLRLPTQVEARAIVFNTQAFGQPGLKTFGQVVYPELGLQGARGEKDYSRLHKLGDPTFYAREGMNYSRDEKQSNLGIILVERYLDREIKPE